MTRDEFTHEFNKTAGKYDWVKRLAGKAPSKAKGPAKPQAKQYDWVKNQLTQSQKDSIKMKTSAKLPGWALPAGIGAAGIGATAGGTVLGHKKGKKKGRREGARVGFHVGSRAGYRSGARRGYVAGQKAMLSRIKEYKSSQAKKGGKEKAASAVIPTWLLTQLIP